VRFTHRRLREEPGAVVREVAVALGVGAGADAG